MTTLQQSDIQARLIALLPSGWFSDGSTVVAPVLNAVVSAAATVFYSAYSLIQYAQSQTRISTASGAFLDLIAYDYFGRNLQRASGQTDSSFQSLILAALGQERVTRAGMISTITALTGSAPVIFEPFNTGDAGAWDYGTFAFDAIGGWGDTDLPAQVFVQVDRTGVQGVPNVDGFDSGIGAFDIGAIEWTDPSLVTGQVTDAQIYQTIANTVPTGVIAWTQLLN